MALVVDSALPDAWRASSGEAHAFLSGIAPDEAVPAMEKVRRAIIAVRHPEEPLGQLLSFASDVTPTAADGATFWFDMADAEAYDGLVESIVQIAGKALRDAGVTEGRLYAS